MKYVFILAVIVLGMPVLAQAGIFGSHVAAMSEPVKLEHVLTCKKQISQKQESSELLSCLADKEKQQSGETKTDEADS